MARKKPGPKKLPKDQLKPERPVVSVRFDPRIFADLKAEASARGVTVTDVVHLWLVSYLRQNEDRAWSQGRADARMPDDVWLEAQRKDLEASLRAWGYTRIVGPGGVLWAEPDANMPASIVKIIQEASTAPTIVKALQEAAGKADKEA